MKRYLALSVIASTLLLAGGDVKPVEPVVEAVEEESVGTFSGQFRAFYVDRTMDNNHLIGNRNSLAVGGWVGYDSAEWNGLSAGFKAYGVEGIRLHDMAATNDPSWYSYDPSLYGDGGENYGFFGEAYLNYKRGDTNLKIGRQKLNTPLAGADDARMLPNLFEAAVLSNTDIQDTTLVLAQVTQMTVGTFGNVYSPGALSIQSGYGLGFKEATSGDFAEMGVVALGTGTDTSGVTTGAVIYKGIENLTLQAWDYYAWDILNAIYLQADYGWNCLVNENVKMKASAQYINQSDVGDALAGDVKGNYWAIKLGASSGALSGYVAYSQTADDDSTLGHGIITPWGGMPAFTQGMVTRHQFFNDTDTWKVAGTYKMDELVGADVKATVYYASFDVGNASYAANTTTDEAGFDIQYQATENLNLRLRANYPTEFTGPDGYGWDEYRVIANYNF
ncbi:OprD family outer membrane porin [Sulfurovum sp.]|uniref:OprD family outer membrane porin n=1 Tax=Sulfurovum sp. TaxID=1969726 RepID=UPI003562322F